MKRYVLDASVAAKWFLPSGGESLADQALSLLKSFMDGQVGIVVPDLFWAEIGNIFWKAVRVGRLSKRSCEEAIRAISALHIPTWATEPLLEDALVIAMGFDQSAYDSIYVALAVRLDRTLVTADERLANALAAHFPIRWLGAIV